MQRRVDHALEPGLQVTAPAPAGRQGYPDTRRADLADQPRPGADGEDQAELPAPRDAGCRRRQPAVAFGGRERRGQHDRTGPERVPPPPPWRSGVLALRGIRIPGKTGRNRHPLILAAAFLTATGSARRRSSQAAARSRPGRVSSMRNRLRSTPAAGPASRQPVTVKQPVLRYEAHRCLSPAHAVSWVSGWVSQW